MNHNLWKLLPETQDFIDQLDLELKAVQEEICEFRVLLNPTEQVMREYCANVGIIEGLKRAKTFIEEIPDEQSETLSWSDESRSTF